VLRYEKIFISIISVLFILNALSVYFGFKNQGTLAMYSNLSVYKGQTNHLIISEPTPLSDNLSRFVKILSSDQKIHRSEVEEGRLVPLKLLKIQAMYFLNSNIVPRMTYSYEGKVSSITSNEDLRALTKDVDFFDFFLSFKSLKTNETICRW
jgi:hypothetical protein